MNRAIPSHVVGVDHFELSLVRSPQVMSAQSLVNGSAPEELEEHHGPEDDNDNDTPPSHKRSVFQRIPMLLYLLLLNVLLEIEEVVQMAPTIRLLENAICNKHYASGGTRGIIDEKLCKINEIQERLAHIRGFLSFFDAIPVLLLGVAFGHLADKYGRKPVFSAAVFGIACQMFWIYFTCHFWAFVPVEVVWISSLFRFLGGGPNVAIAMIMTMASDISTESTRSKTFYRVFSAYLITDLIGPQLSYLTLKHSLWLPYVVCVLALFLIYPVLLVMPNTMKTKIEPLDSPKKVLFGGFELQVYRTFFSNWRILLGLMTIFIAQFRWITIDVLLPYTSIRFGWSLGQTALLITIVSGVNILTFLIVLPYLTTLLQERAHLPTKRIDLFVSRTSCLLLAIGAALMAVAWNLGFLIFSLIVYAAGFGTRVSMLSVITGFINSSHETARLYTLVSMTEAIAHMLGSPLVQSVWAKGIDLGGRWLVLPFVLLAGIFSLGSLSAWMLRELLLKVEDIENEGELNDEEGGEGGAGEDAPLISGDGENRW